MNEYLEKVREAILKKDKALVERLTAQYADAEVTPQEIVEFSRSFGTGLKAELRGSININGAGGSHIPKPNITSIAAMYLAAITGLRVVKTGSGAYSGLWGSSDFFRELGMLDPEKRNNCLQRYGFAYYDYLEISAWKEYKPIMLKNRALSRVFWEIVFFDYEADMYFLGISNPFSHTALAERLTLENRPRRMITYYTKTEQGCLDEAAPGQLFVDNRLFYQTDSGAVPPLQDLRELRTINRRLLAGQETGYWKECLKITCALCLLQLGRVSCMEEGMQSFERAYREKALKPLLSVLEA